MSHHLDSPTSRRDPRLNVTDFYLFDGEAGTAFAMIVNTSLAGAGRVPGFHPEGRYEFKVHLDKEEHENLTYRFVFGAAGSDAADQSVAIYQLVGEDARNDFAPGTLIAEGRTGEVTSATDGCGLRAWAGAAADPFYLDLHQLAHIIEGLQNGKPIELASWTTDDAASSFAGSQSYAIVLEVPETDPWLRPGRQIGAWGAAKLATDAGGWRQVNRAAIPMMWPLFRAIGDADDSARYLRDTVAAPAADRANDEVRVIEFIAAAARNTGTANPEAYAAGVVQRLLPDLLPYQVGTPAAFSFVGFNGRSLADNAPEVMYGLITNSGFPTGLTSGSAAETRQPGFPYVVPAKQPQRKEGTPWTGSRRAAVTQPSAQSAD